MAKVEMSCPVCGNDSFISSDGSSQEGSELVCSHCNFSFTGEEWIERNPETILKSAIGNKDFMKEVQVGLKEIFGGKTLGG